MRFVRLTLVDHCHTLGGQGQAPFCNSRAGWHGAGRFSPPGGRCRWGPRHAGGYVC